MGMGVGEGGGVLTVRHWDWDECSLLMPWDGWGMGHGAWGTGHGARGIESIGHGRKDE